MVKTISIAVDDSQWALVQKGYADEDRNLEDADVTETFVKNALIGLLVARVRLYEDRNRLTYGVFTPS